MKWLIDVEIRAPLGPYFLLQDFFKILVSEEIVVLCDSLGFRVIFTVQNELEISSVWVIGIGKLLYSTEYKWYLPDTLPYDIFPILHSRYTIAIFNIFRYAVL